MTTSASLQKTAEKLVAPGRGILAADESTPTIKQRFESIQIESTADTRRSYRGLLFATDGAEQFISGVILFEETLRQKSSDERSFPELLASKGIVPGIKVDRGAKDLAGAPGEKVTEGLDGLRERLAEYHDLGARFAKWRAVINIDEAASLPSATCLDVNAHALARYAALSVEQGLVPIVEPEVMMDGVHSLETCSRVTERCLRKVFSELYDQSVDLREILLKPNMVVPGKSCPEQASVQDVAKTTVDCFLRAVPAALAGIVFLSGGQTEVEATAHLDAMNKIGNQRGGLPWQLSFSFGRALQASALETWAGKEENFAAAQLIFYHRAKLNSAARYGTYSPEMEGA